MVRRYFAATFITTILCIISSGLGLPARRLQVIGTGAEQLAAYHRAGCDNFTNHEWQPLRPGYHVTVPYGWLNDPHGLFQLHGSTHMFFQFNPMALQWGAPFWAHVVSRDLARWTWLPPALLPDQPYDRNGVWSGSATIDNAGVPVLTYTAAGSHVPEMGNFFQQQALAVPEDVNDPLLRKWKKSPANPFLSQVPPGGTNFQFRDPTEAKDAVWSALTSPQNPQPLPQHHYALAVGNQAFCMGGAGIYTAPNLTGPWSYIGTLYNQLTIDPQINGQCTASRITEGTSSWPAPAYGGPCDQFGAYCRMWEVVDFLELAPGVFMIKWDDQSRFREVFSQEWYVLGNGPWDYSALHPKLSGGSVDTGSTAPGTASSTDGTSSAAATDDTSVLSHALPRKVGRLEPNDGISGDTAGISGSSSSSMVFGQQYSTYPHSSHDESSLDNDHYTEFNYVEAAEAAATKSLFTGELDGRKFSPLRTDYGSVYASTIFKADDRRQIMLSWIYDTAAGCADMCSDELPDVIAKMGFKGVHTLPRQLTFNATTKTLQAYPVEEIQQLRQAQLYNATDALLDVTGPSTLVPVGTVTNAVSSSGGSGGSGGGNGSITDRQFEVQLKFKLQAGGISAESSTGNSSSLDSSSGSTAASAAAGPTLQPGEFAVGLQLLLNKAGDRFVDVYLKGSVALWDDAADPRITDLSVWVNRSQAGSNTNTTYLEGGPVPLPLTDNASDSVARWLLADQPLGLSVWVDHSVIEVFAMGGLARVTSRIYPADDDVAWGLSVWAKPPTSLPRKQLLNGDEVSGSSGAEVYLVVTRAVDATEASISTSKRGLWELLLCWWCKLWSSRCSCPCDAQDPLCVGTWHVHSTSSSSSGGGGGTGPLPAPPQQLQQSRNGNVDNTTWAWGVAFDGEVWGFRMHGCRRLAETQHRQTTSGLLACACRCMCRLDCSEHGVSRSRRTPRQLLCCLAAVCEVHNLRMDCIPLFVSTGMLVFSCSFVADAFAKPGSRPWRICAAEVCAVYHLYVVANMISVSPGSIPGIWHVLEQDGSSSNAHCHHIGWCRKLCCCPSQQYTAEHCVVLWC